MGGICKRCEKPCHRVGGCLLDQVGERCGCMTGELDGGCPSGDPPDHRDAELARMWRYVCARCSTAARGGSCACCARSRQWRKPSRHNRDRFSVVDRFAASSSASVHRDRVGCLLDRGGVGSREHACGARVGGGPWAPSVANVIAAYVVGRHWWTRIVRSAVPLSFHAPGEPMKVRRSLMIAHRCPTCHRTFRTPQSLGLHFRHARRKPALCMRREQ